MEHKDKKIDLDLDFLGKGASEKSDVKKLEPKGVEPTPKESAADTPMSDSTKWILGAIGVAVLIIIIAAASSGGSGTASTDTSTTGITAPTSAADTNAKTLEALNNAKATLPAPKTDNQTCKDEYGSQSYSTGDTKADGSPVCDCNDGYTWNDSSTACVAVPVVTAPVVKTGLQICQERNGYNATYDSTSNSCGCASGYSLSAVSNQCVDALTARDDSCAAKFPGTSYLKADPTDGHPICDCVAGSYFNNDRTACYTLSAFNQSCVNTFGTGSISTTENGKRVCDCGYGYAFNPQRNACVTTASINAICERDVGRNSVYSGSSSDGKYNCTAAY